MDHLRASLGDLLLVERHWLYYAISLGLLTLTAILGYGYGKSLAGRGVNVNTVFRGARGWAFLGTFIASCVVLQAVAIKPDLWSAELSSSVQLWIWGFIKVLVVFMAAMAAPLSGARAKRYVGVVSGLAFGCLLLIQAAENYLFMPYYLKLKQPRITADGTILQSSNISCTAAALANLLPLFGIQGSEKETARALRTTRFGTTTSDLLTGLKAFNLHGYYVSSSPEHLLRMNRPAIITTWIGVRHSVAVYRKMPDGKMMLIDPMVGKLRFLPKEVGNQIIDKKAVVLSDRPVPLPEAAMAEVQEILHWEKYLDRITGAYDPQTQQALKAFQSRYNVSPTGKMDELTYLLLTGPYLRTAHL